MKKSTETAFDTYHEKAYNDKRKARKCKEPKWKTAIKVEGIRAVFHTNKSKEKALEHYRRLYPGFKIEAI